VYSFSMILYQLFEHTPPFAGVDPVEAARQAALYDKRPNLVQLGESKPFPMGVSSGKDLCACVARVVLQEEQDLNQYVTVSYLHRVSALPQALQWPDCVTFQLA